MFLLAQILVVMGSELEQRFVMIGILLAEMDAKQTAEEQSQDSGVQMILHQEGDPIFVGREDLMELTTIFTVAMMETISMGMAVTGWGRLSQAFGATMEDLLGAHFRDNLTFVGLSVEMDFELAQEERLTQSM
jgi:hypothetical protein